MKVIIVDAERFFVAQDERGVYTVAIRLLNERRVVEPPDSALKSFIEDVTESQDGPTAVSTVRSLHDFQVFPAEMV